ncbi:MAG: hypothetical protein QGG36_31635 [Pirellulaceae bacterium]|jgi:hypothetical protein|nr:hypothetical protein [Pirellulaceae bacterium]
MNSLPHLRNYLWLAAVILIAGATPPPASAQADDELEKRASWNALTTAEVRARIDGWLKDKDLSDEQKLQLDLLWPKEGGVQREELLDQTAVTISLFDADAKQLVQACRGEGAKVPSHDFLAQSTPFVRDNMKLYLGRWMARNELYDEALGQLDELKSDAVVDPATLLFYQGVTNHRLLKKDGCVNALTKLLENEGKLPVRYERLAQLMAADLKPLKVDSPDEISRLMDDVQRRLKLGRAGKRVRTEEEEIIAKLDKIIEKLEEQLKQQQGGGGGGSSSAPSSPLQDSQAAQLKGPGDVDQKRTGDKSGWGNLPPEKRRATMQQISREMGAHYRELIEEYFRKLAKEGK